MMHMYTSCTGPHMYKQCDTVLHNYPLYILFSVPVQDNNGVERTFGDCAVRKKYSHIDLIHMIDGVETQKATICAGNRCYYLKVCILP